MRQTVIKFYIHKGNKQLNKDIRKQLYCIFLEFKIDQEQNQIQKTFMNCFMTHFLSLKSIRNIFSCRRSLQFQYQQFYHKFFEFYSIQDEILMHEINYQLLYYTFLDFCSSHKHTLMFHHFLKQLYHIFLESYIDQTIF